MGSILSTEKSIYKVQKKLAYSIFSAGFSVTLFNFIYLSLNFSLKVAIRDQSVLVLFLLSFVVLLTAFKDWEIARFFQLIIIITAAVLAIMDVYNSIHGLGLIFIAIFISLLGTAVVTEYSAIQKIPEGQFFFAIDTVIYTTLFFFVTYLIYSDEIRQYIESSKVKEGTIGSLTKEKDLLLVRVKSLDKRIARMSPDSRPMDLKKYKITATEKRIIEILVLYRAKDQEIADSSMYPTILLKIIFEASETN